MRREDQHFGDFLERVPPVESNMGEFYGSGGRIGQSSVFVMVEVSVKML